MLECLSNKTTHPIDKTFPNVQHPSSLSSIQPSEYKQKCLHCQQNANLLCYACCMQVGCEKCFDSKHFIDCDRQFNKYTISLAPAAGLEESRSKKNGKKSKIFDKCKRCETSTQQFEQCLQCKTVLCKGCSDQVHSKGKFVKHQRTLSQSPQKKKTYQAILTENCEQSRIDRRQNLENFDYGLKMNKQDRSKVKASIFNKMGRSIAKVPFQNQQNTPNKKYRRNSINQSIEQSVKQSKCEFAKQSYQKWELCVNHNKIRNILTQSYDLVCCECYQQLKTSLTKVKIVDIKTWMKSQIQKQTVVSNVQSVLQQISLKRNQIYNNFKIHREELANQLKKKCSLLEQKYNNNIFCLEKWQSQYNKQIDQIKKRCQNFLKIKDKLQSVTQTKRQSLNILNLHSYLVFQQIMKEKKDFNLQFELFQFRVTDINHFEFEDIIKSFAFVRRKIESQASNPMKSLSKMSQSHQLRQSRVSNTSLTTDRKFIKKQESALKSNYYELSNGGNLMKRSMSKQLKEDLTKDISQKILFPISNARSDKKEKITKELLKPPQIRNSNYFFETTPDEGRSQIGEKELKKEGQTLNLGLKQVKYINLETIITEKLDRKIQNNEKRDGLHLSTPILVEDSLKKSIYLGVMTEQLPNNDQYQSKKTLLADHRLAYSIVMTQSMTGKANQQTINSNNSINSNVNLQNFKNKRKSDYMQMRDRLRKPNLIQKIGK